MSNNELINEKTKYIWKKEWVRPGESLISVLRNFRIVNGRCSLEEALRLLGVNKTNYRVNKYKIANEMIWSCIPIDQSDWDHVKKQLMPPNHYDELLNFEKVFKEHPYLFSPHVKYCRKCIKSGYHSVYHQIDGLKNCIFHPDSYLFIDTQSTYIVGGERNDVWDKKRFASFESAMLMNFNFDYFQFDNLIDDKAILPFQWIEFSPKLPNGMMIERIDKNYEFINYDEYDINRENKAGQFITLSKDEISNYEIYSIKYSEEEDFLELTRLKEQWISIFSDKYNGFKDNYSLSRFEITFELKAIYFYLQLLSIELLCSYSTDDIMLREFKLFLGENILKEKPIDIDIITVQTLNTVRWSHEIFDPDLCFNIPNISQEDKKDYIKILFKINRIKKKFGLRTALFITKRYARRVRECFNKAIMCGGDSITVYDKPLVLSIPANIVWKDERDIIHIYEIK